MRNSSLKERMLSTLYGGVIGDMMGVPVEFKARGTFYVEDVMGYGTYNQPPGTWSDDTSLTLCLVENLIEQGDTASLMDKFVQYMEQGYWTPFGEMFDIGITTAEAVSNYKKGILPESCGKTGEFDNGNGALMRIAPLVFVMREELDFSKRAALIQQYTEITHAHPRSIVGSMVYSEVLLSLYRNNSLKAALQEVYVLLHYHLQENLKAELASYDRIFQESFLSIAEGDIQSTGYIVHSLEAALWCVGTTTTFKEAILKAVNLGEDTDTVATLAGTLAGMHYPLEEIPTDWLNKMMKKQEIDQLITTFYQACVEPEREQ
ncbi:ADP-ribosylglycohydrolase family protein [Lysinibacillus macroides]|uniref:ADP-ribosylglycohydrolase n=1 Tax=Lysinibacillus macroides TaxID=33935 RepID=A0A0N0UX45_9BACI|nr:ADP-ribosylglycohydrolase family protein [Lysinibacillus macroides]KOY83165.1 ADP-ribosylglycohydrolase [Lysinibacillus macroides]QPR69019.1 ADP-ribosylglycohydrolase family protein [Lysinibacillus macroides]